MKDRARCSLYSPVALLAIVFSVLCGSGCNKQPISAKITAAPNGSYPEYPLLESPELDLKIKSLSKTGMYGRVIKIDVEFINKGKKDIVIDTHGLRLALYIHELESRFAAAYYRSERLVPFDSCAWLIEDRYFILPAGEKTTKVFNTRYMGSSPTWNFSFQWPDSHNEDWEKIEWKQCEAYVSYWHPFRKLTETFDTNANLFDYEGFCSKTVRLRPNLEPNKPPIQVDLLSARFSDDDTGQVEYEIRVESDTETETMLVLDGFLLDIEWFDRKLLLELNAYGGNPIRIADANFGPQDDIDKITVPPKSTILARLKTSYIGCSPGTTYYKHNVYGDPLKRNWERRMTDRYRVQLTYTSSSKKSPYESYGANCTDTNVPWSVFSEKFETDLSQKRFVGREWLRTND